MAVLVKLGGSVFPSNPFSKQKNPNSIEFLAQEAEIDSESKVLANPFEVFTNQFEVFTNQSSIILLAISTWNKNIADTQFLLFPHVKIYLQTRKLLI